MRRRAVVRGLALAPLLAWGLPRRGEAKDYALPDEVLRDIVAFEHDVDARLRALRGKVPGSGPFVDSVRAVHERHARERRRLAGAGGAPGGALGGGAGGANDLSLSALRKAQAALVYAHAEGLPVLPDAAAVDLLARHMVDEARHLTVIDLWIEAEERRG